MQPTWQDVAELAKKYRTLRLEYWSNEILFSSQWWILFITAIVCIIIWIILLDKKRIFEIATMGLMTAIIANLLDTLGLSFSLWGYPHTLIHLPEIIEIHTILMPIIYMMMYQYFHTWRSFIIAAIINAFVFAYILEPTLIWLQIYEIYEWKHIYSVVPYFIIAVGLKWIIHKFKHWDDRNHDSFIY